MIEPNTERDWENLFVIRGKQLHGLINIANYLIE